MYNEQCSMNNGDWDGAADGYRIIILMCENRAAGAQKRPLQKAKG